MSRRRTRHGAVLIVLGLLGAQHAVAQGDSSDVVRRLERQMQQLDESYRLSISPDQPISERLLLDYGGTARFGAFSIDDAESETHVLRQSDLTLYLRAELDGTHRFFTRARLLYNDWSSVQSFDDDGDELEAPILDRYWYQFDLRGAVFAERGERIANNFNFKIGRQYTRWGSGLTLSNVLYAILMEAEIGDFDVRGLAGITPSTGTVDFDGSRPGFDADTDRAFYGVSLEYRGTATHHPYVSYLVQRDENERDFATFSFAGQSYPTRFQYDSEYLAIGSYGSIGPQLTYRIEAVHETGSGLSSSASLLTGLPVTQTKEDIDAWAGVLNLTYLTRNASNTRIEFQIVAGSGDGDRGDSADTFGGNQSGTNDEAFNSLGYVNTGLALAPEVSNLLSYQLGVNWTTRKSFYRDDFMRAGISGFLFTKIDTDTPLNIDSTDGRVIGGELDFAIDWRLTSDVNLNVRYGIFIPGEAIPKDANDLRHFIYMGVSYAF